MNRHNKERSINKDGEKNIIQKLHKTKQYVIALTMKKFAVA